MADHFDVVSQRQTWVPGAGIAFDEVMEITIKTKPSGLMRKLDVPLNTYNHATPEELHDLLEPIALDTERKHSI